MKTKILNCYHASIQGGYQGYNKPLANVHKRFYRQRMTNIKQYCANCISCNQGKTSPHIKPAPLQKFNEVLEPFKRTSMDIVGPLKMCQNGNKYILAVQNAFS